MKIGFTILVAILIVGCATPISKSQDEAASSSRSVVDPAEIAKEAQDVVGFWKLSQPYLERYGSPEKTDHYIVGPYQTITWLWFSKGFEVAFETSGHGEGWHVLYTHSFDPTPLEDMF